MARQKVTVWGIHGGRRSQADGQFLKGNCIALGWVEMPDLSVLGADREAFKARVAEVYPHMKPTAVPNHAGQLFRFVHEMKPGDIVVYPSKVDRHIHIGRIEGPYRYTRGEEAPFPHVRHVKWLRAVVRTKFSQGALYEIGSALSLFQIKSHAEEFRRALEGEPPAPPKEDSTIKHVADDIEESTRDFILKRLAQELKGHPLADFVSHLLGAMGYRTRVSPEGPDGGIDILAHRDELGFEAPIIKVQVKATEGTVGAPVVQALSGTLAGGEHGLVVTLGTFAPQARSFARGKANLRLVDGEELVELIVAHYEQFDSRYKGLIPLRKVYVPEPLEETET